MFVSKIWIGSTGSRWSSRVKTSKVSGNTRRGSKDDDRITVQSNSKEGSSLCQCTMTLIGQNKEIKQIVSRVLSELLSMLDDLRKDIGHFWVLDPGRKDTEPMKPDGWDKNC